MPVNIASEGAKLSPERSKLIPLLQSVMASLVRAHYQYHIAAIVVSGNEASAISADLIEHANDDIGQFVQVANRIFELEGTVSIDFNKLDGIAEGDFQNPQPGIKSAEVLTQTLKTIQGAIKLLNAVADLARSSGDHVTTKLAKGLLEHEVGHERTILNLLEDVKRT